jgi:hypothetical protein
VRSNCLQVRIEPADQVMEPSQAAAWFAGAREVVILLWEADESDFSPQSFELEEELFGLLDWAAQVLLIVDDQKRRGDVLGIADRRVLHEMLGVVPGGPTELVGAEVKADVARPEH